MMRILFFHNRYQQAGGEDNVVHAEIALLRAEGHEVDLFEDNNDGIVHWIDAASTALGCVYSHNSARTARRRIQEFAPDLVHVHNFFPRLSPSIHYVCHEQKIPVVQTLHNYRLLCPASTFLRNGSVCEDCLGKTVPWPAVQHGCYHSSRLATAAVANMLSIHRGLNTWSRTVSTFIALTKFAREKFIEGGLPEDRITVKPNFVSPDPGIGAGTGGYALFVGRLSEEKGLGMLLEAWKKIKADRRLKIIGDGPMAASVRSAAETIPGIEWLGPRNKEEVSRQMAGAAFLVFPSIWYESLPLVLIEALATGLPVIASRLGAIAEVISDGETGRLVEAGSSNHLASEIDWAFSHPDSLRAMRHRARREFERKYTAELNYAVLSQIYQAAIDTKEDRQKLTSYALQN
jgi:glycosyltransferase involved in cell wall biosynthesis